MPAASMATSTSRSTRRRISASMPDPGGSSPSSASIVAMHRRVDQPSSASATTAPHQAYHRFRAGEHQHGLYAALYIAVRALLDAVRAYAPAVLCREVQVGQGVCLGILEQLHRLPGEAGDRVDRRLAGLRYRSDLSSEHTRSPGARRSAASRPREALGHRPAQPLVGVVGHPSRTGDPGPAHVVAEPEPSGVGLGVEGGEPTTRLAPSAPTATAVTATVDCARLSRRNFT